ncbi:MAG: hypothetical protein JXB04_04595 [Kiritimatiellae bacterium]|nr:hypothetical protein [Kiritimatiellia bacterium]
MPGLLGYWTDDKAKPADAAQLAAAAEAMRGRPELKVETTVYPGFGGGRVHLGHLQPRPQPAEDAAGTHRLWLDGEFNNAADLAGAYDLAGPELTRNQAAMALALYEKAGWDFLGAADGLFNIALYDATAHRLTLANDRYGLRPLFWARTAAGFAYAGEVKALLKFPELKVEIDRRAVDEWFTFGYLLGNRTWIRNIEMLPPASIWEISKEGVQTRRYWSWNDVKPRADRSREQELVEELGSLWMRAVKRRASDDQRLGQGLSGGLDSRAILAALPPTRRPYHAYTVGEKDCADIQIARQAAQLKDVQHHVLELSPDNWLASRSEAVWQTDGMGRVLDLHVAAALGRMHERLDVDLSGYLGDATAGGGYLGPDDPGRFFRQKMLTRSPWGLASDPACEYLRALQKEDGTSLECLLIEQRGRRFINTGPVACSGHVDVRMPFFDRDFLDCVMGLPAGLRRGSYIYNRMLLHLFPEFYERIPWQCTGQPIRVGVRWRMENAGESLRSVMRHAAGRAGIRWPERRRIFHNYPVWLRIDPGRRFVTRLLLDPGARYRAFLAPDKAESLVRRVLETDDNSQLTTLGLLLSFEIYLRQLSGEPPEPADE